MVARGPLDGYFTVTGVDPDELRILADQLAAARARRPGGVLVLPPGATLSAHVDNEARQQRADEAAEREADIYADLSDAHARATGARLPDPEDSDAAAAAAALAAARDTLTAARKREETARQHYQRATAEQRHQTAGRAYSARAAAAAVVAGLVALIATPHGVAADWPMTATLALAVALALPFGIALVLGICAGTCHGRARDARNRIPGCLDEIDAARDNLQAARVAYLLAGGNPDGGETEPAPTGRTWWSGTA